jgi:methylated-DNA-protein-cysteine methyltransferase-like protein
VRGASERKGVSGTGARPAGSRAYADIYAAVRRIPRGRVATYGQIARVAGLPGHARMVGYALSALREENRVPWHRVVNAAGRISLRSGDRPMDAVQRFLLEREGVCFGSGGAIRLRQFQWRRVVGARPRLGDETRRKEATP